ncbi:hypothetical protein [Marininema halotolerans]|uniref:Lipoprotein n=1 Tax=Marininema halotolerans TaxID=1155944 RepID=A0A1I6THY2_9BACL|nr:hypothetical protein [Marininema halotolerans]SFS88809.1 hypothetical protein SAMN05444972_11029 [Marininema halotolerans]
MIKKRHRSLKWIITSFVIFSLLTGCGGYEDLDPAEKVGVDYVIEMYTSSKRDLTHLSQLTGRNKSKEGIAHIKPFLKTTGTVWVGSSPTSNKEKRAVYVYFSPEISSSSVIKGVYVEQRGKNWIYAGDIALKPFPHEPFEKAQEQSSIKKLSVDEWEKVEVTKEKKSHQQNHESD